jgi:peptide/nickel transport system ATP-binding protein
MAIDQSLLLGETTGTATPLVEISDLRVFYKTVAGIGRAVDGVNLTMQRGEILGVAGESGCGKSTLANAMLRLTRPPGYIDGGSVRFHPRNGEAVDLLTVDDKALRRIRWNNLAYIPQGSMNSLNPVMRIADQFVDAMQEHGYDGRAAQAKVPELLRMVNLAPYVARLYPHELSGGMKQRVIIAMAISLDPDLVIADEPTTALDVNVQRIIIQTLAELRDRLGMSIMIVSHDMAVHAELVDRVAVMYAGQIVEVRPVRQVFKEPLHPYTQGLIGAIPQVGGTRVRLEGIGGSAPNPTQWPEGCRFHPRCRFATAYCQAVHPELLPVPSKVGDPQAPPALVACHLYHHAAEMGRSDGR